MNNAIDRYLGAARFGCTERLASAALNIDGDGCGGDGGNDSYGRSSKHLEIHPSARHTALDSYTCFWFQSRQQLARPLEGLSDYYMRTVYQAVTRLDNETDLRSVYVTPSTLRHAPIILDPTPPPLYSAHPSSGRQSSCAGRGPSCRPPPCGGHRGGRRPR